MEKNAEKELIEVLTEQDRILDLMLIEQGKIHDDVKNRNWADLQVSLANMNSYSDDFVVQDEKREKLTGSDRNIYFMPSIEPLYISIRTKLSKSRIENEALNKYVNATQTFIDGVLEACVPQKRNVLYSPNGIVKKPVESVVINTLF